MHLRCDALHVRPRVQPQLKPPPAVLEHAPSDPTTAAQGLLTGSHVLLFAAAASGRRGGNVGRRWHTRGAEAHRGTLRHSPGLGLGLGLGTGLGLEGVGLEGLGLKGLGLEGLGLGLGFGAWVAHVDVAGLQKKLAQSPSDLHDMFSPQRAQELPPQSTALSSPFFTPSVQVGSCSRQPASCRWSAANQSGFAERVRAGTITHLCRAHAADTVG